MSRTPTSDAASGKMRGGAAGCTGVPSCPESPALPASPGEQSAARARAFRAHVEPEVEVLLRVARTLTGSWADAEDLTQETLIRAWRAADRFDGAHPRAWLLTILRRTHLNMHRRQRPDTTDDLGLLDGARPAFDATSPPTPEEQVLAGTLPAELEHALDRLGEPFRTVVLLIDVDGVSYAEAATLLGVPVGTVMSRLSRGRQRLRAQLRPQLVRERSAR